MYGIIYRAINRINGKLYIGKTTLSLEERIRHHYYKRDDGTYFHKALKKYSLDAWEWSVIDSAETQDELNTKERFWIAHYNSMDNTIGYNRTEGGDGFYNDKVNYDKARDTRIKNKYTPEELAKRDLTIINKRKRNRAVRCVETQQIFISAIQAAQIMFSNSENYNEYNTANAIRKAATGQAKTGRGYHWEYLSEYDARQYAPGSVQLIETGEIFRDINQASQLKHQSTKNIRACCNGEIENNAGYHWKWVNK